MAEQFYTILTAIGKAKIANANVLGDKIKLTTIAVGDGNGKYYNPVENQENLINEVWKGNIQSISIDKDNPNWIIAEAIIPSNVGGFMIREVGLFNEDDELLVIAKYPETYKPVVANGATKDLRIRLILEVSNAANVTLKINPAIVFATKEDIQEVQKALDNIDVPVKSINSKTGKVELTAEDIKTNSGDTVESQLRDIKNECDKAFQSGVKAKQDVVTALTSKDINVTTSNTWEEISDSIKNLKLGYVIDDLINLENTTKVNNLIWDTWYPNDVQTIGIDSKKNVITGGRNTGLRKFSSNGNEEWVYKGVSDVNSVVVDSQDNIIFTNHSSIIKVSSDGIKIWEYNISAAINKLIVDNNSNIYAVGMYLNKIIKISSEGILIKEYPLINKETGSILIATDSNNNIIYSGLDTKTVNKISSTGSLLWTHSIGGDRNWLGHLLVDNRDNIIIAGLISSSTSGITKINSDSGEVINKYLQGHSIFALAIDNFNNIVCSHTAGVISKINQDGSLIWEYTYSTKNNRIDEIYIDNNNIGIIAGEAGIQKIYAYPAYKINE